MRTMFAVTVAAAMTLAGCNMGADLTVTDAAVKTFHTQLDAGQFDAIQASAGPEMKGPEVIALFENVHTQLGNVKSSSRTGFSDNVNNGLHTVNVTYATVFDGAPKTETFLFRMVSGSPQLMGYQIK